MFRLALGYRGLFMRNLDMFMSRCCGLSVVIFGLLVAAAPASAGPIPTEEVGVKAAEYFSDVLSRVPGGAAPYQKALLNSLKSKEVMVFADEAMTAAGYASFRYGDTLEGKSAKILLENIASHLRDGELTVTANLSKSLIADLSRPVVPANAGNMLAHELIHAADFYSVYTQLAVSDALVCLENVPKDKLTALLADELATNFFFEARAFSMAPTADQYHLAMSGAVRELTQPGALADAAALGRRAIEFNSQYYPRATQAKLAAVEDLGALKTATGQRLAELAGPGGANLTRQELGALSSETAAAARVAAQLDSAGFSFAKAIGFGAKALPAVGVVAGLGMSIRDAHAASQPGGNPMGYVDSVVGVVGLVPSGITQVGAALYAAGRGGWEYAKASTERAELRQERDAAIKQFAFGTFMDTEVADLISRTLKEAQEGKITLDPRVKETLSLLDKEYASQGGRPQSSTLDKLFSDLLFAQQEAEHPFCKVKFEVPKKNFDEALSWD